MNLLSRVLLLAFVILFLGCSQSKLQTARKVLIDDRAIVTIIMDDDSEKKNDYRIYVNNVDLETTLMPNGETSLKMKSGDVKIQIVRRRETASIDLTLQKNRKYRLRVIEDERKHIELLEIQ